MRILVIEDTDSKFNDIRTALNKISESCEVNRATSYFEAMELLRQNLYDLVITDNYFPESSSDYEVVELGNELIEDIHTYLEKTPIIMCSSSFCDSKADAFVLYDYSVDIMPSLKSAVENVISNKNDLQHIRRFK